jgi:hypothetical protein
MSSTRGFPASLIEEFRKRVKVEGFTPDQREDPDFFTIVLDQLPDTDDNYDLIQRGYEIFLEQSDETDPEFYEIVDLFETRLGYEPLRPRSSDSPRRVDADEFWLDAPTKDFENPLVEFEYRRDFPGFVGTGYVDRVLSIVSSAKAFGWSEDDVEQILAIAARNLIEDSDYNENTVQEFMRLYDTGRLNPFDKVVEIDRGESIFTLALINGRVEIIRVLLKKEAAFRNSPDAIETASLTEYTDNWEVIQLLLEDGRFDPNFIPDESKNEYIVPFQLPLLNTLMKKHYRSMLALVSDPRTEVSVNANTVLIQLFSTWDFSDVEDLELDRRGLPKIKAQLLIKIVTHPKFQPQKVLVKLVENEHGLSLHYLKLILNARMFDVTEDNYAAVKAAIKQLSLPKVKLLLSCPQVFLPDAFDLFSYVDVLISENQRKAHRIRNQYQMLRQIREQFSEGTEFEITSEDYEKLNYDQIMDILGADPEDKRTLIFDYDGETFQFSPSLVAMFKGAALGYESLKSDVRGIFNVGDRYMDFMDVITTPEQAEQWYNNDDMAQLDEDAYDKYRAVKESLSEKRRIVIISFVYMLQGYRSYQENIVSLFNIRNYMDKVRDQQFNSIIIL